MSHDIGEWEVVNDANATADRRIRAFKNIGVSADQFSHLRIIWREWISGVDLDLKRFARDLLCMNLRDGLVDTFLDTGAVNDSLVIEALKRPDGFQHHLTTMEARILLGDKSVVEDIRNVIRDPNTLVPQHKRLLDLVQEKLGVRVE